MFTKQSRMGFIGSGSVGKALAVAMSRKGYPVVASASRTFASAQTLAAMVPGCTAYRQPGDAVESCDVVFITTPDDAIGPVAAGVPWREGQAAVHCSGAASLDVLEDARRGGATPGAMHPLQTFSSVEETVAALPGSTFAIEGDGEIRGYLTEVVVALGGNPIYLRPEDKPLYHASVVMLGGIVTGLAAAVADMWQAFGIERDVAVRSLAPILKGDGTTLESVGVPAALAGPYVRGDVGSVRKHLDALAARAPEILPTYCRMALTGLPYVFAKGSVSEEVAGEIRKMLTEAIAGGEQG